VKTLYNNSVDDVWGRIRDKSGTDITHILTDLEMTYNLEDNTDAPTLGWAVPADVQVLRVNNIRAACEVQAVRPTADPAIYNLWARWGGPSWTIALIGKFRVA
jgi:hypothetical protein